MTMKNGSNDQGFVADVAKWIGQFWELLFYKEIS
jgi:hypothetical protein